MFSFSNHTFLLWRLDVHDWSCFPLCGITRNTCYSSTELKSNIKICLVLTATKSGMLKDRPGQQWFSTQNFSFNTCVSFTGSFSVFQTCQESKNNDYFEESTDTEEKDLITDCWITIFLHGQSYIDLSALFSCPFLFFLFFSIFAVKNSRLVFGQMDRSWPMLPREEINSAVDWGPCLSLGFIRCWCWQCERTTCTKRKKGKKPRIIERRERVNK